MTMISAQYHLVPYLVINHLKTDKGLFLHMKFLFGFFNATLFDELAAETNRYVSEKKYLGEKTSDLSQVGSHHN
jgi:hypothetical protein